MAAARLAHRPHWTVRDLADRLADPDGLLTGLFAADHTTADAFALSYHQLAPGTRRTFRLLGLHPGTHFDVYAVAALTGATLTGARLHLDELVDAHLVEETQADRYRLHDLVRAYAAGLVAVTDADQDHGAATRGLLDYYLHAAAKAGERFESAVSRRTFRPGEPLRSDLVRERPALGADWLDAERSNLVTAVHHAADRGLRRYAWMLSRSVGRYLYLRGFLLELLATHDRGLAAAEGLGDPEAVATIRNYLAVAHLRLGNAEEAVEHMRHVVAWRVQGGDRLGEAVARKDLAIAYVEAGRHREAAEEAEKALVAARASGDVTTLASALINAGHVHLVLGRYATALRHSRLGLMLAREVRSDSLRATALGNVGAARGRLGEHEAAIRILTTASRMMRRAINRYTRADTLNQLGAAYRAVGRLQDALVQQREALEMMRQAGDPQGEYAVCNELARTLHATGDTQAALDLHRHALTGTTKIGHKYGQARALDGIATCLRDTDPTAAGHHWTRALRLYLELDAPERDQVHHNLAALHG
jgi:tetratricopeptide (TPR) repeat protein